MRKPKRPKLIELTTDPVTGVSTLRIWRFVSQPWIGRKAQAEFERKLEAIRQPVNYRERGYGANTVDPDLELAYMAKHRRIWPTARMASIENKRATNRVHKTRVDMRACARGVHFYGNPNKAGTRRCTVCGRPEW